MGALVVAFVVNTTAVAVVVVNKLSEVVVSVDHENIVQNLQRSSKVPCFVRCTRMSNLLKKERVTVITGWRFKNSSKWYCLSQWHPASHQHRVDNLQKASVLNTLAFQDLKFLT